MFNVCACRGGKGGFGALTVVPASLLAHTIVGTTINGGTTGAIDTTGVNLLVVAVSAYQGGTPVLTDSKSNTWVPITGTETASTCKIQFFYCASPTVGSGHTFTVSGANTYAAIAVQAWANAPATLQTSNTHVGNDDSTGTGGVTTTEANELVVTAIGTPLSGSTTYAINTGTISDQIPFSSAHYLGLAMAYYILAGAGATNPTWSGGSGASVPVVIAAFKS